MNKERIEAVIGRIQNEANYFSMAGFESMNSCRTPACICGQANYLRGQAVGRSFYLGNTREARDWLGLTDRQANALFFPDTDAWSNISREQAIATLRHLMATGKVNWSIVP